MDSKRKTQLTLIINQIPSINKATVDKLVIILDALIFNMTALACIFAIINEHKQIKKVDLTALETYVKQKCSNPKQSGGTILPSDYFGVPNQNYKSGPGPSIAEFPKTINFDTGIARQEYGGGAGAGALLLNGNKNLIAMICSIAEMHKLKISKLMTDSIINLIDKRFQCFINCFKGTITVTEIDKELKKPGNMMFL